MVAIDIEFEEEETKESSATSKKEAQAEEISLEFSASTELINLAAIKSQEPSEEIKNSLEASGEIKVEEIKSQEKESKSDPKIEISDEMKAVVNKVKAETAKVRSLDEARQKRPASAPTPSTATAKAAPAAARPAPLVRSATAAQVDIFNENKNAPLLERLDPMTKVEVEAEIRIAKAEARGEVSAFYLSEAKLLEYQIISLLKRLPPKTQEDIKTLQQIQKQG